MYTYNTVYVTSNVTSSHALDGILFILSSRNEFKNSVKKN